MKRGGFERAEEVRARFARGETMKALAVEYHVTTATIANYINLETYAVKHVPKNRNVGRYPLKYSVLERVRYRIEGGYSPAETARLLGISERAVRVILEDAGVDPDARKEA